MKNQFEYFLFIIFSKLFCFIGLKKSRKFVNFLVLIFYRILKLRRRVTEENLQKAFPNLSKKEIDELTLKSYQNFAICLIEILSMPAVTSESIKEIVKIANIELLNKKYDEGKGVILLSAHFNNWEYAALAAGFYAKENINVVVKHLRNPFVDKWMNDCRTKFNNKTIPLGVSIRHIFAAIKEKKIVGIIADQRGPKEGIKINFFNNNTSVYSGPAVLALKMGAPLIMGLPVRQPDYSYLVELAEINQENLPEDENEKIKEICQRQFNNLEMMIKKNPASWFWMHNIWKY
ncbi:MAG: hypothetical protein C0425_08025 [Chlorobiaceae bacterium]|nr:hypothetical protein [Chlorobiaceae bacterium]MBA4310268.1 hypothetical protein [Chlorobiaceae bacterium]